VARAAKIIVRDGDASYKLLIGAQHCINNISSLWLGAHRCDAVSPLKTCITARITRMPLKHTTMLMTHAFPRACCLLLAVCNVLSATSSKLTRACAKLARRKQHEGGVRWRMALEVQATSEEQDVTAWRISSRAWTCDVPRPGKAYGKPQQNVMKTVSI